MSISYRLPEKTAARLRRYCLQRDIVMGRFVAKAVEEKLDRMMADRVEQPKPEEPK